MNKKDLSIKEIDTKDVLKKKWLDVSERVDNFYNDIATNPIINASGSKGAMQTVLNLFAAGKLEALIRYYWGGNVPAEWQEAFTLVAKRQAKK
jgi:hypothetical protein